MVTLWFYSAKDMVDMVWSLLRIYLIEPSQEYDTMYIFTYFFCDSS